jgi:hypothetical protein
MKNLCIYFYKKYMITTTTIKLISENEACGALEVTIEPSTDLIEVYSATLVVDGSFSHHG